MTIIEVRSYRNGWKVFEARGVEPVFLDQRQAIDYATCRVDPLHAFVGGDVVDPAVTIAFLRNGLNPIQSEFSCAAVINHHTPKTTYRDTSDWTPTEWIYAGAGNADLTNWARAILVIDATHAADVFRFRAAKRGKHIGWADENGHRVFEQLFCHQSLSDDVIFWRDATQEDLERVSLATPNKQHQKQSGRKTISKHSSRSTVQCSKQR